MKLPDPLVFEDGRRVTTKDEWRARRKEILALFATHVYGRSPGPPEAIDLELREHDAAAMNGEADLRRVAVTCRQGARAHGFEVLRLAPRGRVAKRGAFLFLNNRGPENTDVTRDVQSDYWPAEEVLARGYAVAAVQTSELAPDDPATFRDGVMRLFDLEGPDAWKMIGAWAWGASRALDCLEADPLVDASRVAVIGHSRGGKTALWAAAQDERFALAISNESGNSGAAISRRPVGESIERINVRFPHWFADNYRAFDHREDALPIDQHMLIALLAPRGVAIGSAADNEWADPEGEYLGLAHASSVYALYEREGIDPKAWPRAGEASFVAPRGYHLRHGKHDLTKVDWERYLDVADRVFSGEGGLYVRAPSPRPR